MSGQAASIEFSGKAASHRLVRSSKIASPGLGFACYVLTSLCRIPSRRLASSRNETSRTKLRDGSSEGECRVTEAAIPGFPFFPVWPFKYCFRISTPSIPAEGKSIAAADWRFTYAETTTDLSVAIITSRLGTRGIRKCSDFASLRWQDQPFLSSNAQADSGFQIAIDSFPSKKA